MSVIKFEPNENHFVAKEYADHIAEHIRKVTGVAGAISYQFLAEHKNTCTFNVAYCPSAPAHYLGPQPGVYCVFPSDTAVVSKIAEEAIHHILELVDIISKHASGLDIYQLVQVLKQIFGDAIEDEKTFYRFLVNSLTGGDS